MIRLFLSFTLLLATSVGFGQSIQEICPSANTNGTVVNCEYFNDTLYATGFFDRICGQPVGYIAKWENNSWQPSAISISDPGHALKAIDNKLYIARYEQSLDSNWLYVYDNGQLQTVGSGVFLTTASGFSALPNIYDVLKYDGKIVACGEFDRVGTDSIQGIMQWDGNQWNALGSGLSGNIINTSGVMFPHQLMVHNSELYVAGNFRYAGGIEVNGIAKWDGNQWSALGAGFNNTVYSMIVYNNELIVGGSFTESNGTPLNRIAKWDGTDWVALDFGFSQPDPNRFIFVHTLKEIDGVLYIAGGLIEITYPDNSTEVCNGIVSLQNATLNTFMGGVPDNDIEAICKVGNNDILVGGGVFGNGYTGITQIGTSIQSHHSFEEVNLFPNPFEEWMDIEAPSTVERYEITNELGQIIRQGALESRIYISLPAGLYFLKLLHKDQSFSTHKIIHK
ncbi:MAG: T9SS type A sorting domain-containing protein [Salibacteraceae bacterium]